MKQTNKFSLIELLVVIGIIAILAAILLPALSRSKESARLAVCLSNQKQFAMANHMYATDYNDYLAFSNWLSQERRGTYPDAGWLYHYRKGRSKPEHVQHGQLYRYLTHKDIYFCPSDTVTKRSGTNRITSYSTNGSLSGFGNGQLPSFKLDRFISDGIMFFDQDNKGGWNDGSNFHHEVGSRRLPMEYRLPSRHDYRSTVTFIDASARVMEGAEWADIGSDRPGQFYYDPGSSTGK